MPVHTDIQVSPTTQVSWGELIDKITILEIKEARLKSPKAIINVRRELAALAGACQDAHSKNAELARIKQRLRLVNETLWDIEDRIRAKEAAKRFDWEFIELARAVYLQNDRRSALKAEINALMNSEIVEEKQYVEYSGESESGRLIDQHLLFANSTLRVKQCRHGVMMFYANDSYIGRSLDLYGEYSEGEIELFKQIVRPGMTVVDVGANIGAHTIWFSKAVGPGGRVFAFEPQRALYHILCGNIALNLCANVISANVALGVRLGSVVVPSIDYARGGNFGGMALGKWESGEPIPLQTLDSYSLTSCGFMKVDVEGMEQQVLEGAKSLLAAHQPILYVENDRAEKSEDLISLLMNKGYRLYWHLPRLFSGTNYFGRTENIYGKTVSVNMICIPRSKPINMQNFREITSPEDKWRL
jgi:FkbM family methyltransferase